MSFQFGSATGAECQRCAQLGIQEGLDEKASNKFSNLVAQRLIFDPPLPPYLSSCPSCRSLCRRYLGVAGSLQPSQVSSEDLTLADANHLLRSSLFWVCRPRTSALQEVSRCDDRLAARPVTQDTFGKVFADGARGTVRVVQKTPNYAAISAWLDHCWRKHQSCQTKNSPSLQNIVLVDVHTTALVSYPGNAQYPTEYLALSYVWGPGVNYRISGLGPIAVEKLPQTIRDSITVTKALGMRYLWVDAVCIDQYDEPQKKKQLGYMASIYRGASATIVAADSENRDNGLSRVRLESKRSHQLRIEFGNGNFMLQKFPSLQEQLGVSKWMQRGWTYQEALLSQRLIFFTKHQVYYCCNGMSCCEALDDERAFGDDTKPISGDENIKVDESPKGVLQFPAKEDLRGDQLSRYQQLVNLYLNRQLSDPGDILRAFWALLQDLQELAFPAGFWHGLPKKNFPQSLLWRQEFVGHCPYEAAHAYCSNPNLTTRRVCSRPLPSWSWIGWNLSSMLRFPHWVADEENEAVDMVNLEPPLKIETGKGQVLFDNLPRAHKRWHLHHQIPHSSLVKRGCGARKVPNSIGNPTFDHEMEEDVQLKIRGIVLELPCRTSVSRDWCWCCQEDYTTITPEFDWQISDDFIETVFQSKWYVDGPCNRFAVNSEEKERRQFLLLQCHHMGGCSWRQDFDLVFDLLIIHWENGNAIRGGTVSITVGSEKWEDFWEKSGPRLEEFWLV